ncbi:uncharacterized protein LOC142368246 [Odontesthes bonariensis]|uniref:uncharacterized protein LOC142368246 n=1 Tax=Odontesthes bonariensis TaxID=219752 RepID=UPI003F58CBC6
MNLWLCCHLLFAALFHSSSALTPEECQPLVTPLSLADPSVMYGKVNFLAGFADHDVFKAILKVTESSWVNVTGSPSSPTEAVMSEGNKINGICLDSRTNMTIKDDIASATLPNMTWALHVLPSCDGCLLLSINSTVKNTKKMLEMMKVSTADDADEIRARSLYLLGRELTVKDSDLEHFKKQASCLGFSGELDFLFNPEKSFCKEGEGIKFPFH